MVRYLPYSTISHTPLSSVCVRDGLSKRGALARFRLSKNAKSNGGWSLQDAEGVEGRGETQHCPTSGTGGPW